MVVNPYPRPPSRPPATTLFAGAGDLLAACRAIDWAATALGPVEGWPASLLTAVRLCLDSPTAMCVWAGDDGVLIYNDAYARTLRPDRHPWALGRPAREVWGPDW